MTEAEESLQKLIKAVDSFKLAVREGRAKYPQSCWTVKNKLYFYFYKLCRWHRDD